MPIKFDPPKKIRITLSSESAGQYIDVTADSIDMNATQICTAMMKEETVAEINPNYFVAWCIVE